MHQKTYPAKCKSAKTILTPYALPLAPYALRLLPCSLLLTPSPF